MTAQEAREITRQSLMRQYEKVNEASLSIIFMEIRSAAEKGIGRIESSFVFSDDMVLYLENMGYSVPAYYSKGGLIMERRTIEWE